MFLDIIIICVLLPSTYLLFDEIATSCSVGDISKSDITTVELIQFQFFISIIKLREVGSKFLWSKFQCPWKRFSVSRASCNIGYVLQYIYLIWDTLIWWKSWETWLQDEKQYRGKNKNKLMKKVIILFSGGNKEKLFVRWVQFIEWHPKFEVRKGRKSCMEQKI